MNYFNNRRTIARKHHVAALTKRGLILLVIGLHASPYPKAATNNIIICPYIISFLLSFKICTTNSKIYIHTNIYFTLKIKNF